MTEQDHPINVVGAGLAGSMAALLLARQGKRVRVIEARPDIRLSNNAGASAAGATITAPKRSLNFALSHRGLCALEKVGLAEAVQPLLIPMHGRYAHDLQGNLSYHPYGLANEAIYSVTRCALNTLLLDALEKESGVEILFETKMTRMDAEGTVFNNDVAYPGLFTIGADGAYSAVRENMRRNMRMDFSMSYIPCGYKELCIPRTADGDFALKPVEGLHIWPRGEFMMIALPNPDKSFTCTLFAPFTGPNGFESIQTEAQIERYFQTHFPDFIPLSPSYIKDFMASPASSLLSVRCDPWMMNDRVVLMGDAAHASLPFSGQGMNSALEDALIFSDLYEKNKCDAGTTMRAFNEERVPAGHALCGLSLDHFEEMRSKGDPLIIGILRKFESKINAIIPSWIPLYTMMTFTRIPYHEVDSRAKRQDRLLRIAAGVVGASGAVLGGVAGYIACKKIAWTD